MEQQEKVGRPDVQGPYEQGDDAFSVEWQLGPDEGANSATTQISQDEEARMLERRLLRLHDIYHPSA